MNWASIQLELGINKLNHTDVLNMESTTNMPVVLGEGIGGEPLQV
jgi:hypothetical protein